jgi:hypothetical protein
VTRRRLLVVLTSCVLVLALATAYVLVRRNDIVAATADASRTAPATVPVAQVAGTPRIYFRNTALGPSYGRVSMVALADPHGPRAVLDASCDRLFVVTNRSLCVSSDQGVVTTYHATVGDTLFRPTTPLTLVGFSSRARLSADGMLATTTTFVAGDSYLSQGFSTRVFVTDLRTGQVSQIEDFTLLHDGQKITAADRNFWGVTFAADDRTFYLTASWAGQTWLARGDLTDRTLTTVASNVECPSLSPDGTRIGFKKRVGPASDPWRVMVRNLATGTETAVAETRSVDDQVLWLDNATLAYTLPRTQPGLATSDVWSVPADGSGAATVLVSDAFSPAVVP